MRFLKGIAGISLLGMMLLTVADVIGSVFGYPVLGAEEMVALWASIMLAFALPAAHLDGSMVGVDLLYLRFPKFIKTINDFFVALVSCVLFVLMSWQALLYANELRASGEVTMTLQLPAYMLVYAVSFALIVLAIVIFFEMLSYCTGRGEK